MRYLKFVHFFLFNEFIFDLRRVLVRAVLSNAIVNREHESFGSIPQSLNERHFLRGHLFWAYVAFSLLYALTLQTSFGLQMPGNQFAFVTSHRVHPSMTGILANLASNRRSKPPQPKNSHNLGPPTIHKSPFPKPTNPSSLLSIHHEHSRIPTTSHSRPHAL